MRAISQSLVENTRWQLIRSLRFERQCLATTSLCSLRLSQRYLWSLSSGGFPNAWLNHRLFSFSQEAINLRLEECNCLRPISICSVYEVACIRRSSFASGVWWVVVFSTEYHELIFWVLLDLSTMGLVSCVSEQNTCYDLFFLGVC
jgi:hypothetical protein